jgi:hypothetical protein
MTTDISHRQQVILQRLRSYTGDQKIQCVDVFYNHHTLRLSRRGKVLMCKFYEFWQLEPVTKTTGNLLVLLRKMSYPYFLNSREMVLFSEQDAFMCKMAGSQSWLNSK